MRRFTAALLLTSFVAFAGDQGQVSLTRNASSPQNITTQLSRDEYRYEERIESYTEQVPYTIEVPYPDEKTYFVPETRCNDVPRIREVCHTEQRCEQVPRRECHDVTRCTQGRLELTPDVEAVALAAAPERDHADRPKPHPKPNCRTVQVCEIRNETVCRPARVCHNKTKIEHVCRVVQIPHTRIVTRYRTETHYRPEQRSRVVTVPVFDHTWSVGVNVVMPEQSTLQGNETESVFVALGGTEQAPEPQVRVESGIFNYNVLDTQREGNQFTVRLGLVAKFAPGDLGRQTVTGLLFTKNSAGTFVRFHDAGVVARTNTRYQVEVLDQDLGQVVFSQDVPGHVGVQDVMVPIPDGLNDRHDHLIRLSVDREGIVLTQAESFQVEEVQLVQLDPKPYVDPNGVREFSITGSPSGPLLIFTDATPNDGRAVTSYQLKLEKKVWGFLWKTTVAEGMFNRADLKNLDGKVVLPLSAFPGMTREKVDGVFDSGVTIYMSLAVRRVSERLKAVSPVQFSKSATVKTDRQGH